MKILQMLLVAAVCWPVAMTARTTINLDGTDYTVDTLDHCVIGPGVTQTRFRLGSGTRAYALVYQRQPGQDLNAVVPKTILGKDILPGVETPTSMGTRHNEAGDRLLCGINGDFFVTSSFASVLSYGDYIVGFSNTTSALGGKIAAHDFVDKSSLESAFVAAADAEWYIDHTELTYTLRGADGATFSVNDMNWPRSDGGSVFYNSYYGAFTGMHTGRECLLMPAPGEKWRFNEPIRFTVASGWSTDANLAIPGDGLVISRGPEATPNAFVDSLKVGDEVELMVGLTLLAHDNAQPHALEICGGDVRILKKGVITRDALRWIDSKDSPYQRTVCGYSQDRDRLVFIVVDGVGINYAQCADLLLKHGCYDALAMDGGGSSAMWSAPFGLISQPRDGERAVGNGFFMQMADFGDDQVHGLRFADYAIHIPQYMVYQPVVYGYNDVDRLINTNYSDFTLSVPDGCAQIDGQRLIADNPGTFALTATDASGQFSGTVAVTVDPVAEVRAAGNGQMVVDNLHPMAISLEGRTGEGDDAQWLAISPLAFDWTSSDDQVATVDADGRVCGHANGTVTLTGTRDGLTVALVATVQAVTRYMALLPDAEIEPWIVTPKNCTIANLAIAPNGCITFNYTLTGRAPSVKFARKFDLWSTPDAVRLLSMPADPADVKSVTVKLRAANSTGGKVLQGTVDPDDGYLAYDIAKLGDKADPQLFPVEFQDITINFNYGGKAKEGKFNFAGTQTYYADAPDAGVSDITVDAPVATAPVYYNLQGARIANPAHGNIYIRVDGPGRRATKIIY